MGPSALGLDLGIRYFLYGTLCHPPLLARVIGREVEARPASLPGHAVRQALSGAAAQAFPLLCVGGAGAPGLLIEVTEAEAARLAYYESCFSFYIKEMPVETDVGAVPARVFFPSPGQWAAGGPWQLADWQRDWGEIAALAAEEVMAGMGRMTPQQVRARYPAMLARAASRLRARGPHPARVRRTAEPGDVRVNRVETPYRRFFAIEEYDLSHRQFAGGFGPVLDREAFVSVDAAVVLPYDPIRDRVLVIEQFRVGPFARGDSNPWLIEPIAGRIDAGETPEDAARREALEEAGLALGPLLPAPSFYPTPGAKTEYLYCFIGLADIPDAERQLGGVADEGEDIRAHLLSFDELMALLDSGEADNGPLVVLALWLARHRPVLRARAEAEARRRA